MENNSKSTNTAPAGKPNRNEITATELLKQFALQAQRLSSEKNISLSEAEDILFKESNLRRLEKRKRRVVVDNDAFMDVMLNG
jgi:hypothetical protein